jgi:hypothetical protein
MDWLLGKDEATLMPTHPTQLILAFFEGIWRSQAAMLY